MGTVLVVSSDTELGRDWSVALESAGHTVLAADVATDGVSRLREGGIDVMIVGDHRASELNDLVSALDRLPDPPPFVMVSRSPRAPEISAHLGAAAFVPRPCSAGEIVEVIARLSTRPVASGPIADAPRRRRTRPGTV